MFLNYNANYIIYTLDLESRQINKCFVGNTQKDEKIFFKLIQITETVKSIRNLNQQPKKLFSVKILKQ